MTGSDYAGTVISANPEKSMMNILPMHSGRDNQGHVSSRHHGGRNKRYYRDIDFKRDKTGVWGEVVSIEYDPNRNANIALLFYSDGSKAYVLAPEGLTAGEKIISGSEVEIKTGNALPIGKMPIGAVVHNIELNPGRGGILARGAGGSAKILSRDENYVTIKLPSGETRMILTQCMATVGVVSNIDHKNIVIGKAGRARHMGRRPKVRGVAQNPRTHPHGGGEGRSGEGMKQPKTPWGKPARGLRTRKKNIYSDKYIVERRKKRSK